MSFFKGRKPEEIFDVILKRLTPKTRFARLGLPFLITVVGGSFVLKYFASLRYEYKLVNEYKREDFEKAGIEMRKPEEATMEAIYEEVKKVDIDNWVNIRGPRPWEESEQLQAPKQK